jgi:hypothetical protein
VASLSRLGVKNVVLFLCLNKVTWRMLAIMRLSHTLSKTVVGRRLFICTKQSVDR